MTVIDLLPQELRPEEISEAFVLGEENFLPAVTTLIGLYGMTQYPILRMKGRSRL